MDNCGGGQGSSQQGCGNQNRCQQCGSTNCGPKKSAPNPCIQLPQPKVTCCNNQPPKVKCCNNQQQQQPEVCKKKKCPKSTPAKCCETDTQCNMGEWRMNTLQDACCEQAQSQCPSETEKNVCNEPCQDESCSDDGQDEDFPKLNFLPNTLTIDPDCSIVIRYVKSNKNNDPDEADKNERPRTASLKIEKRKSRQEDENGAERSRSKSNAGKKKVDDASEQPPDDTPETRNNVVIEENAETDDEKVFNEADDPNADMGGSVLQEGAGEDSPFDEAGPEKKKKKKKDKK